jgi:hypothetical protein
MAPKAVDARKRSDWNRRGNAIENGLLSAEINPVRNDRLTRSEGCVGPTPKRRLVRPISLVSPFNIQTLSREYGARNGDGCFVLT